MADNRNFLIFTLLLLVLSMGVSAATSVPANSATNVTVGPYLYLNFTIPANTTTTAYWQVDHGNPADVPYNATLNTACVTGGTLQTRVYSFSGSGDSWSYGQCYNGASWVNTTTIKNVGAADDTAPNNGSSNTQYIIDSNSSTGACYGAVSGWSPFGNLLPGFGDCQQNLGYIWFEANQVYFFNPNVAPVINSVNVTPGGDNVSISANLNTLIGVTDADSDPLFNNTIWFIDGVGLQKWYLNFDTQNSGGSGVVKNYGTQVTTLSEAGAAVYDPTRGVSGGSYNFAGAGNTFLNGVYQGALAPDGDYTLSQWVYPTATNAATLNRYGDWLNIDGGWNMRLLNGGGLQFEFTMQRVGSEFDYTVNSGAFNLPTNQWSLVTVTMSSSNGLNSGTSTVRLYVDGIQRGTNTVTGVQDWDGSNLDWRVGGDGITGSNRLRGNLDEIIFVPRTLSIQQILSIYNEGTNNQAWNTIVSQETTGNEKFSACMTVSDLENDSNTLCSANITTENTPPVLTPPVILTTSNGLNDTAGPDITLNVNANVVDVDDDTLRPIIQWFSKLNSEVNLTQLTTLLMPIEASTSNSTTSKDYANDATVVVSGPTLFLETTGQEAGFYGYNFTRTNSDSIIVTNPTDLNSDVVTVEAFVKTSGTGVLQTIVDNRQVGGTNYNRGYSLMIAASNQYQFSVGNNVATCAGSGTTTASTTSVDHVVGVYNKDTVTLSLYVNGVLELFGPCPFAPNTPISYVGVTQATIGSTQASNPVSFNDTFSGDIYEVNIYGESWDNETVILLNETRGINISTATVESLSTYQTCATYTDGMDDTITSCSQNYTFDRIKRSTTCVGLFDHLFDDSIYFLESDINTSVGCYFGSLDNVELQCNGFDIGNSTTRASMSGTTNGVIRDCTMSDGTGGILVINSINSSVINNTVTNMSTASIYSFNTIPLSETSKNIIEFNTINEFGGMQVVSDDSIARNNVFNLDNQTPTLSLGLLIGGNNVTYENNIINGLSHNGSGGTFGIAIGVSNNTFNPTIRNNTINGASVGLINLGDVTAENFTIIDNTFNVQAFGMALSSGPNASGTDGINFSGNTITIDGTFPNFQYGGLSGRGNNFVVKDNIFTAPSNFPSPGPGPGLSAIATLWFDSDNILLQNNTINGFVNGYSFMNSTNIQILDHVINSSNINGTSILTADVINITIDNIQMFGMNDLGISAATTTNLLVNNSLFDGFDASTIALSNSAATIRNTIFNDLATASTTNYLVSYAPINESGSIYATMIVLDPGGPGGIAFIPADNTIVSSQLIDGTTDFSVAMFADNAITGGANATVFFKGNLSAIGAVNCTVLMTFLPAPVSCYGTFDNVVLAQGVGNAYDFTPFLALFNSSFGLPTGVTNPPTWDPKFDDSTIFTDGTSLLDFGTTNQFLGIGGTLILPWNQQHTGIFPQASLYADNYNIISSNTLTMNNTNAQIDWGSGWQIDNSPRLSVILGDKFLAVDSNVNPQLNAVANITFRNINCTDYNLRYTPAFENNLGDIILTGSIQAVAGSGSVCTNASVCDNVQCSVDTLTFTSYGFSSFGMGNNTPPVTVLISPNGTTLPPFTDVVNFVWSHFDLEGDNITAYQLQIDNMNDFTTPLDDFTVFTNETSRSVTLNDGIGTYYWRVRTADQDTWGSYALAFNVTVQSVPVVFPPIKEDFRNQLVFVLSAFSILALIMGAIILLSFTTRLNMPLTSVYTIVIVVAVGFSVLMAVLVSILGVI